MDNGMALINNEVKLNLINGSDGRSFFGKTGDKVKIDGFIYSMPHRIASAGFLSGLDQSIPVYVLYCLIETRFLMWSSRSGIIELVECEEK